LQVKRKVFLKHLRLTGGKTNMIQGLCITALISIVFIKVIYDISAK